VAFLRIKDFNRRIIIMITLANDSKEKVFKTQEELIEECIENGIPVTGHEDIETLEMFLSASDDDDDFDDDDDDDFDDDDELEDEEEVISEIEPEDEDEIYDDDFDFDEDEDDDDLDDEVQYN
jgi:hypothetical protein